MLSLIHIFYGDDTVVRDSLKSTMDIEEKTYTALIGGITVIEFEDFREAKNTGNGQEIMVSYICLLYTSTGWQIPVIHPFQCFRMRGAAKRQEETAFRNSFGLPTDPFPTLLASDVTPFAFWYEGDPDGGCIRFLTETESERLMGLPEGWTKYGADGEEIRPLQRYKALGNAIALPCADYIMAGIYGVLADRAGKED